MAELYLCRHGETEWTLSGKHTGKTDIGLTSRGKEQAAHLRKKLGKVPFEAVFSSPKKRALETSFSPCLIDRDLEEWDYGNYEGKTSQEIHEKHPYWDLFEEGAPGGESPMQVAKRADVFLKKIQTYSGKVAIFSHGHFLRVLAARFLGLNPDFGRFLFLSVASLSILGQDRGKNVILLWNEVF